MRRGSGSFETALLRKADVFWDRTDRLAGIGDLGAETLDAPESGARADE